MMPIHPLPPRISRPTLALVVAAHAAVAALALTWSTHHRPTEPTPLMVTLMAAPPEPDRPPVPLPTPPAPEPAVRPEPPRDVAPRPMPKTTVAEPIPAPERVYPEPEPEPPPAEAPRPLAETPAPPVPVPAPPPAPVATSSPEMATVALAAAKPDPPRSLAAPAPATTPAAAPAEADPAPQVWQADYLRNPKPEYPNSSRRMGEHGTVILRVLVNPAGDATRVELKGTSGYRRLDDSALLAVRQWKFVPARLGEQPVAAWVLVPIRFTLKG